MSTRTKLKRELENKAEARCQLENKAMKINMLRGKERKKRKKEYICNIK